MRTIQFSVSFFIGTLDWRTCQTDKLWQYECNHQRFDTTLVMSSKASSIVELFLYFLVSTSSVQSLIPKCSEIPTTAAPTVCRNTGTAEELLKPPFSPANSSLPIPFKSYVVVSDILEINEPLSFVKFSLEIGVSWDDERLWVRLKHNHSWDKYHHVYHLLSRAISNEEGWLEMDEALQNEIYLPKFAALNMLQNEHVKGLTESRTKTISLDGNCIEIYEFVHVAVTCKFE